MHIHGQLDERERLGDVVEMVCAAAIQDQPIDVYALHGGFPVSGESVDLVAAANHYVGYDWGYRPDDGESDDGSRNYAVDEESDGDEIGAARTLDEGDEFLDSPRALGDFVEAQEGDTTESSGDDPSNDDDNDGPTSHHENTKHTGCCTSWARIVAKAAVVVIKNTSARALAPFRKMQNGKEGASIGDIGAARQHEPLLAQSQPARQHRQPSSCQCQHKTLLKSATDLTMARSDAPAMYLFLRQSHLSLTRYNANILHLRQQYRSQSLRYHYIILASQRITSLQAESTSPSLANMCHSRHTTTLSRFAVLLASQVPDQLIREITDIAEPPQDTDPIQDITPLHLTNPRIQPVERVFHLDGSEDNTASIDFLLENAHLSRIVDIPLEGSDFESHFAVHRIALLRHRIWLNNGHGPGSNDDFRLIDIRGRDNREDGRYLARLDNRQTTPGGADLALLLDQSLNTPLDTPSDLNTQFTHLEFEGVYAPVLFTHHQRSAIVDQRLHAIATRIAIFHGRPCELTRLPVEFMGSLDEIESLFDQICEWRHEIDGETLDCFKRALDQIERTASLVVLHRRLAGAISTSQADRL